MSTWNHRVVKFEQKNLPPYYAICEVFYEDGVPFLHTSKGAEVGGDSIDELRQTLQYMIECLDKPILDEIKNEK